MRDDGVANVELVDAVPSELVLIPAGHLAHQGQTNVWLIVLASTVGGLVGASLNYVVSMWLG